MTTSNFDEYAQTQIDELKLLDSETHTSVIFKLDSTSFNKEAKEHIIIGRIFPNSDIFNEGAFQIQIKVPPYYPLNTPTVKFITPIYHPSVNKDGEFHHELLLKTACWTSKTTLKDIVKAIVQRIDAAEVYWSKNCEVAEEYEKNKKEKMAGPGGNRRIMTEVSRLQALATNNDPTAPKFLLDKSPMDTPGSNIILGRILPRSAIYNQAAFQIELKLPNEYPFKAPEIRFITPIYHPNVNEEVTPLTEIVKDVIDRIDNPDVDHALNADIAAEYTNNKSAFDRKAAEMVKKHGLPRT
ncbi:unnamed protein product [Rotaria magnacalcarata]